MPAGPDNLLPLGEIHMKLPSVVVGRSTCCSLIAETFEGDCKLEVVELPSAGTEVSEKSAHCRAAEGLLEAESAPSEELG